MGKTEYVEFEDVRCIAETGEALCVKFSKDEHWIPKSLLHPEDNEIESYGDTGTLVIPQWFVDKRGIEE